MKERRKPRKIRTILSTVYLLLAVCILLGVCGYCYPKVGEKARQVIAGATDSPMREAFGVLTDGLSQNRPVKEVLSQSYEVFKGEST